MAVLVGIDEAGYGPLMGPLVVSSVAFDVPESLLRENLWDLLQRAVASQKKGLSGRLLIADSKKAYNRKTGPGHLRRTVHAALAALADSPCEITGDEQLLRRLCPDCVERVLDGYPWYEAIRTQPAHNNPGDIPIAAGVFKRAMADHGIALRAIRSRCLDVGFYNSRVEAVKNKSRVLFTELCTLVLHLLEQTEPDQALQIVVDRQGGRINYLPELARMFPGFALSILRQDETMSSYELTDGRRSLRIHFCLKADGKYLPVSLASMTSKYLREVLMESLNAFFAQLCPDLTPTAGYWQDGQRFIRDLQTRLPDYRYDRQKLIRIL
jgi:hypothetical protein